MQAALLAHDVAEEAGSGAEGVDRGQAAAVAARGECNEELEACALEARVASAGSDGRGGRRSGRSDSAGMLLGRGFGVPHLVPPPRGGSVLEGRGECKGFVRLFRAGLQGCLAADSEVGWPLRPVVLSAQSGTAAGAGGWRQRLTHVEGVMVHGAATAGRGRSWPAGSTHASRRGRGRRFVARRWRCKRLTSIAGKSMPGPQGRSRRPAPQRSG